MRMIGGRIRCDEIVVARRQIEDPELASIVGLRGRSASTPGNITCDVDTVDRQHLGVKHRVAVLAEDPAFDCAASLNADRQVDCLAFGEELSWRVVDFAGSEEIDDVVVELTTNVARLELTVPMRSADVSAEPLVFIFPENRQRWLPGLAFQSSVQRLDVGGSSATALRGIAEFSLLPGRYFVVAINTGAVLDPADPALLDRLVRLATPINLIAGETRKLAVPLANAPR